nr:glycoprotein Xg isoform X17 [Equus asinus]
MESRWGLWCVTFLCFLTHARGQGDFDLADALDDPEPTKKPSSDIHPRPKPPYHPQPGMPDNSGNIYPPPKPPPRPHPGSSDSGGGFLDGDRGDGRYPPRPRQPAGGGGGHHPGYDGYGSTHALLWFWKGRLGAKRHSREKKILWIDFFFFLIEI